MTDKYLKKNEIWKRNASCGRGSREGGAAGLGCGSLALLVRLVGGGECGERTAQPPRLGHGQLAADSRHSGRVSRETLLQPHATRRRTDL